MRRLLKWAGLRKYPRKHASGVIVRSEDEEGLADDIWTMSASEAAKLANVLATDPTMRLPLVIDVCYNLIQYYSKRGAYEPTSHKILAALAGYALGNAIWRR